MPKTKLKIFIDLNEKKLPNSDKEVFELIQNIEGIQQYINSFFKKIILENECGNKDFIFYQLIFFVRDFIKNLEIEISYNGYSIKQPANDITFKKIGPNHDKNEYYILAKKMNELILQIYHCLIGFNQNKKETKKKLKIDTYSEKGITPSYIFNLLLNSNLEVETLVNYTMGFNEPYSKEKNKKYNMKKIELICLIAIHFNILVSNKEKDYFKLFKKLNKKEFAEFFDISAPYLSQVYTNWRKGESIFRKIFIKVKETTH